MTKKLGIIDFLKTKTPKKDLAIALKVLREFKKCESSSEWLWIPFAAWAKLEQLEEYLDHLANGKELAPGCVYCADCDYLNNGFGKCKSGDEEDGDL